MVLWMIKRKVFLCILNVTLGRNYDDDNDNDKETSIEENKNIL